MLKELVPIIQRAVNAACDSTSPTIVTEMADFLLTHNVRFSIAENNTTAKVSAMIAEYGDNTFKANTPWTCEGLARFLVRHSAYVDSGSSYQGLKVRVRGGWLVAKQCPDSDYPGIDVEFEPDEENEAYVSTPGVRVEHAPGERLRALVWADPTQEDYTDKIYFKLEAGYENG